MKILFSLQLPHQNQPMSSGQNQSLREECLSLSSLGLTFFIVISLESSSFILCAYFLVALSNSSQAWSRLPTSSLLDAKALKTTMLNWLNALFLTLKEQPLASADFKLTIAGILDRCLSAGWHFESSQEMLMKYPILHRRSSAECLLHFRLIQNTFKLSCKSVLIPYESVFILVVIKCKN